MIVKYAIALILPFILVAGLSRFSLNAWVGLIATLGIMMAAFDGAYQPLPVILTGVVSGLAGLWLAFKILKNKNLTK
ncbi:DUF2198 family protein [Aneurinibacillus terranovensis]|uniref:DUF2198 family protein n=1 Tax=Aneurinibacillus terranovensis TaxID=278991 RepID=UPI000414FE7B|nr:DUF2198 family protein [Aneurinibacillus terranovensis]